MEQNQGMKKRKIIHVFFSLVFSLLKDETQEMSCDDDGDEQEQEQRR